MTILRAVVTAFSCFSTIPMPQIPWDDRNMRYMMAAFPLVGAVIGALWWLWGSAVTALGLTPLPTGVGYMLVSVLVTGGIHLDGLADVIDAQASHASPERKREILRDPHVGAFAIIGICSYLMAFAALASELSTGPSLALACVPVISRCLSGCATVTLHATQSSQMLAAEQASSDTRTVRIVLAVIWLAATALMVVSAPVPGAVATVAALGVLALVRHMALTQFGGMSGDLAGYLLQMVELAMLACLVLAGRVW